MDMLFNFVDHFFVSSSTVSVAHAMKDIFTFYTFCYINEILVVMPIFLEINKSIYIKGLVLTD